MDIYISDPDNYKLPQWIKDEVFKVSHRAYCTGFYFGHPKQSQYYENGGYIREYDVVAVVEGCSNGRIYAQQRNKFNRGDELEILPPDSPPIRFSADHIYNEAGEEIETANHATMELSIMSDIIVPKNSIIRKKN